MYFIVVIIIIFYLFQIFCFPPFPFCCKGRKALGSLGAATECSKSDFEGSRAGEVLRTGVECKEIFT